MRLNWKVGELGLKLRFIWFLSLINFTFHPEQVCHPLLTSSEEEFALGFEGDLPLTSQPTAPSFPQTETYKLICLLTSMLHVKIHVLCCLLLFPRANVGRGE